MKKMKRKLAKVVQVVILGLVIIGSFAACSKKPATELTGFYESTQDVGFFSAYPQATYKQATFSVQTIEAYSDSTYCLTSTGMTFSGGLTFNEDGTHSETPRGSIIMKYYGTFTSKEEEGLITLTLSTPTSVIANSSYGTSDSPIGYVNTKAWTEEMGTAVGSEGTALTAEEYLATVAYPETTVIVDTTSSLFDYATLAVAAE